MEVQLCTKPTATTLQFPVTMSSTFEQMHNSGNRLLQVIKNQSSPTGGLAGQASSVCSSDLQSAALDKQTRIIIHFSRWCSTNLYTTLVQVGKSDSDPSLLLYHTWVVQSTNTHPRARDFVRYVRVQTISNRPSARHGTLALHTDILAPTPASRSQ